MSYHRSRLARGLALTVAALAAAIGLATPAHAAGTVYFVSPSGADTNSGTSATASRGCRSSGEKRSTSSVRVMIRSHLGKSAGPRAEQAAQGAPQARQVADRWHLLVRRFTRRSIPVRDGKGSEGGPWVNDLPGGESQRGQEHVA